MGNRVAYGTKQLLFFFFFETESHPVTHDTTTGKFHYQISFYVTNGAQGRLTGAFYFRYLTQLQQAGIHLLD